MIDFGFEGYSSIGLIPTSPTWLSKPIIEKKRKTNKTENGSILNYDYYILSKKL